MVGELYEEKRAKFTLEQNISVKSETKERNQSEISEKSSDFMKNNLDMEIQDYEDTDAVMEIQPQRKTETTLKAVEYEPQLDKLNVESSECSQRTKNSEATMKTNEDNRAEETVIKEKIKARGKQTLSFTINKFTPPYPTTAAVDEDHLDRSYQSFSYPRVKSQD